MGELWLRNEAWRVVLDPGQRAWQTRWDSHDGDAVNGSGRQRGKSFAAFGTLDTFLRRWPGARARYCALTIDTAQAILGSAMTDYLATCPEELKPRHDGYDYVYPNGSALIVMGTDAQTFRRGRGFSRIGLDVRDEFCFYQDLDSVEAALNPGLQVPGPSGKQGRCLRISTPALTVAHPSKLLVDAAKAMGRYELETFYDNPRIDPENVIRKECERLGYTRDELLASTWFRREYLGQWVTEESRAAVPAWTDDVALECIREYERPSHYHAYTGHDWGGQTGDPHAALFGFVDFRAGKLVVEDESELRGIDTAQLTKAWKDKETQLWGERAWDGTLWGAGYFEAHSKDLPEFLKPAIIKQLGPSQPFLRVCDTNQQLQADMMSLGYALMPTRKDDKHLMVDALNVLVRERRLVVNPRCRRLLEQLRTTLWNRTRSEWERTPRDHGDLIDCLVYIVRNIFWNHDPFPAPPPDYWGQAPKNGLEDLARAMTGRRR